MGSLRFNTTLAEGYSSASQIARVLTEDWLARNMYCPICGEVSIKRAEPNAPVKDYICENCKSQYELKSRHQSSNSFTSKVNDGVYRTMIDRIMSLENPSFFFMNYDKYEVNNLIIVPKCFFVPEIIEKRKALADDAQRAGWIGCNILLGQIPQTAKIPIIKDGEWVNKKEVVCQYHKIFNLRTATLESRGWLFDIFRCIEKLDKTFTIDQMYSFSNELGLKHPKNTHVNEKIRQQLQVLRDKGLVEFLGRGLYRKII